MLVEVIVPVMLTDCVPCTLQGADPVIVRLPPERVPVKLKLAPFIESVIVPVRLVPDWETVMLPTTAVSVVTPLVPRPWPDCSIVAVPETVPLLSEDTAVTVQTPAMFMPEFPLELLLLLLLHATGISANALPSRSTAKRKLYLKSRDEAKERFVGISFRAREWTH
jgi:hypothetical protein